MTSINTPMDWLQVAMVIVVAAIFIKGKFDMISDEDEMRARYENE